jgi:CheY-like chemotaxis protein
MGNFMGLPVTAHHPRIQAPQLPRIPHLPTPVADKQTILVVEDQAAIRRYMVSCLEDLRYHVLASPDPAHALRTLRQHNGRIDLLLTNFSMPEMSGPDLACIAREEQLGIKVVYMSGNPEEMVWGGQFLSQKPLWLAKPFTTQLLAAVLRKSLVGRQRIILLVDGDEEVREFPGNPYGAAAMKCWKPPISRLPGNFSICIGWIS